METIMSVLAPFATVEGWGQVAILMFLELALGIDNLVFISITSNRIEPSKQHIGRRLGLMAAMVMRCILLCTIVWIMSINVVLFVFPFGFEGPTSFDVRALVFLLGGIYLIYKGLSELKEEFDIFKENPSDDDEPMPQPKKHLGLVQAVLTIMVMDIVFSLDSVITAAGLSGQIPIMIVAVIGAVLIMIVFADPISNFINNNFEVKVVALMFITLVGVELILESFQCETIAGAPISTLLYAMMIFGFLTAIVMLALRKRREKTWKAANTAEAE